jgi:acetyl esterase/lipase
MSKRKAVSLTVLAVLITITAQTARAQDSRGLVVELWPKAVRQTWESPDKDETATTSPWRDGDTTITRVTNVANPTITVCRAKDTTGAVPAVIVCPGGGYSILAWDLEGTEIVSWLNSLGITGVLLKYRVPKQRDGALQDAQRAIAVVRHRAKEWGIDPQKIGVLGFSAGGHLAARLSTNSEQLAYKSIDACDTAGCNPSFTILIYPAYLATKDDTGPDTETLPVTSKTPPTFMAIADKDRFTPGCLHYALALRKAKVPVELHVFGIGGHGCGLRPVDNGMATWPKACAAWLQVMTKKGSDDP